MTEFLSFKPQNQDVDWERITRFQQRMNQRQATICAERAELITQAYQTYADQPPIIKKALALDLILTKMTIP
ncbi:hypothetical protein SDC9_155470 [bioreactor metagenome]|uniref:PFL domain-containing protein n=1 Tax=bioreactor metagenome TaxID=1076179 RepID=A0A645F430_9ZZZZ